MSAPITGWGRPESSPTAKPCGITTIIDRAVSTACGGHWDERAEGLVFQAGRDIAVENACAACAGEAEDQRAAEAAKAEYARSATYDWLRGGGG